MAVAHHASRPDEQPFADIQGEVPSYAGHFIDAQGRLAAYVADSNDKNAARASLQRRMAAGKLQLPRGARADIVILTGQYTFQQLSDWRDSVSQNLFGRVAGLTSLDLDEEHNRVTIGALRGQEASVKAAVLQQLPAFGIPAAAVRFESVSPIVAATAIARHSTSASVTSYFTSTPTTLADYADPLVGGMQFEYADSHNAVFDCTIGYTASLGVAGTPGFVSAAHCSDDQYTTNSSPAYQPTRQSQSTSIGYESWDPVGGTCPSLWPCQTYRNADANIYTLTSSRGWQRGTVARPAGRQNGTASAPNVSSNPYLYVVATQTDILQGQSAEKIGRSTGWTYGTVTNTCQDFFYNDRGLRCGYKAQTFLGHGDSGSPVFTWDGRDGITAIGIVGAMSETFAGNPDSTYMYFSKWANVLGDLTDTGSPTCCINIITPVTMSGNLALSGSLINANSAALTWSPVTVTNASNTTVYYVTRSSWDASTYTWLDNGAGIGSSTGTSYNDYTMPLSVYSYVADAKPDPCYYSYVVYSVTAYNSGIQLPSTAIYFQGAQNGTNPNNLINCQQ